MATKVLTLRLEEDAWRAVQDFKHAHSCESPSAAIRVMIDVAARDVQSIEVSLRRAFWREGVRNSAKKLRDKMDAAVAECLGVDVT